MIDTNEDTTPTISRPTSLWWRWLAAAAVIGGVFTGARVMDSDAEPAPRASAPAEHRGNVPTAPHTTEAQPDDVIDDLFPDAPVIGGGASSAEGTPEDTEWVTVSGDGAAGGTWAVALPVAWTVEEVETGMTMFHSPAQPNTGMVVTRRFVGPFEDEVNRDLSELQSILATSELISVEPDVDVDGHQGAQAVVRYVNPKGKTADVLITWVRGGDSLYLLAGEAPAGDARLQEEVVAMVESLTIGGTT